MPVETTIRYSKVSIYRPEIKPKIKAAEKNRMDWCLAMISSEEKFQTCRDCRGAGPGAN